MITDRYLYKLEWSNNTRNVFPIEDGAGIVYEKEDYMAYFRPKFNGSLIFVNDHKSGTYDFSEIYTKNWYDVFKISVYRTSRSTAPIFVGQFRKYDGVFDADKCTFTVTPEALDEYSEFIYKSEDEVNIVAAIGDTYSVFYKSPQYPYESKVGISSLVLPKPIPTPVQNTFVIAALFLNTGYPTTDKTNPDYGYIFFSVYPVELSATEYTWGYELRRDYAITVGNTPPDTSWSPLYSGVPGSTPGYQNDGTYKWVRPYRNLSLPIQNGYLPTPHNNGYILDELLIPAPTDEEARRNRKVDRVMEVFAGEAGLLYQSKFFQDSTNYVFDKIGYPVGIPNTVNPLNDLMVLPKSEMVNKSDAATKYLLKFTDMIRGLHEMFNVKWFIENGYLRIEHVSYFDDPPIYGNDITTAEYLPYIDSKNKWSYDFTDVKSERWKFMEAENIDFVGYPVDYTNLNVNLIMYRDSEIIEHNVDFITTDLYFAMANPSKISKDGLMMFQVYLLSGKYEVGQEIGYLSQYYGYNRHLSIANLHQYYWRYRRLFPYGQMNNAFTNFLTTERMRIQTEVTVPACDIDVNKLIKTELGWGEVKEATEDFKTRTIKLVIAHYD